MTVQAIKNVAEGEILTLKFLVEGIVDLRGDLSVLADLLADRSPRFIDDLKSVVADQEFTVVHGYPRQDSKLPLWTVTPASDSEVQKFVGGGAVEVEIETDLAEEFVDYKSAIWQAGWTVTSWANNADLTMALYQIAKQIILSRRGDLEESGLFDLTFNGGALSYNPDLMPTFVYVRTLTIGGSYITAVKPREAKSFGRVIGVGC